MTNYVDKVDDSDDGYGLCAIIIITVVIINNINIVTTLPPPPSILQREHRKCLLTFLFL